MFTYALYGPNPSYTFTYYKRDLKVDLQVTDLAGNTDNDSLTINVIQGPGRIWGQVTDINGTPIARAWVRLGNSPYYTVNWTNTTGYYSFDNISYGNYEINVRKRDYRMEEAYDLLISEDVPTIHIDFKLTKIPEEEPEICLPVYGLVIFILIIFFSYLFLKVRRAKREGSKLNGEINDGKMHEENSEGNEPSQSPESEDPLQPPT
jgi:hypothetical protein